MIQLTISDDMRIQLARIVSERMFALEDHIMSPWSYWKGDRTSKGRELERCRALFVALTTGKTP